MNSTVKEGFASSIELEKILCEKLGIDPAFCSRLVITIEAQEPIFIEATLVADDEINPIDWGGLLDRPVEEDSD